MSEVSSEYQQRFDARTAEAKGLQGRADRLADLRLLVFGSGVVLGIGVYYMDWLPIASLFLPVAAFMALVFVHEKTHRARARATLAAKHYARGLDRVRGTWAGKGDNGLRFQPEHHPYASDLDLFGDGGLFELISTAQTQNGAQTVAGWLLDAATPESIVARHEAIRELRDKLDLREQLGVLGAAYDSDVRPRALEDWANASPDLNVRPAMKWPVRMLSAVGFFSIIAAAAFMEFAPLVIVLIVCLLAHAPFRTALPRLGETVGTARRELNMLARVLRVLEDAEFRSPPLRELQQRLRSENEPASGAIARLDRLVSLFDMQRNQMFLPFAIMLLWGIHVGGAIEQWRKRHRAALCAHWIPAVGELEALCALSGYAYEHPCDVFPDCVAGAPRIAIRDGGHALLPEAACVRNDVTLDSETRVLMVSGSNMSGKSTLLRTVGLNLVLAQAGAPVRATKMSFTPLALGATIRVTDSIQEGASRFYAEIQRFRIVLDLAQRGPMLFLADEILHGTNSHDRCVGAEGLLRALLDRGALGMVTTHDLAITALADTLPHMSNIHLQDHLEHDKLAFDYKVRPGVVEKSNALELMQQVGLPV